jgi:hypothetical protein
VPCAKTSTPGLRGCLGVTWCNTTTLYRDTTRQDSNSARFQQWKIPTAEDSKSERFQLGKIPTRQDSNSRRFQQQKIPTAEDSVFHQCGAHSSHSRDKPTSNQLQTNRVRLRKQDPASISGYLVPRNHGRHKYSEWRDDYVKFLRTGCVPYRGNIQCAKEASAKPKGNIRGIQPSKTVH